MIQQLVSPGTVVGGRFRVEEVVGTEGSIIRCRATHLDLERAVELHVLHRDADRSPDWHSRFRQQVRVLGKLRHPNVVRTFDYGQLENGMPYYVVDLVDGPTLFRALLEGPLKVDQTIALVRDVLSALDYTHRLGIFHLNLTPARVYLPERPAGLNAQITEFMLGRWHEIEADDEPVSDLRVVAPELLRGEMPTPAADVYAVGHLLYACMYGALPLSSPSEDVARAAHLHEEPWHLPQTAGISESIRTFAERCIAKDRAHRFQTARDAIEAIDALTGTSNEPSIPPAGVFPNVGDTFAERYRIDAMVGSGGFARVFDAQDTVDDRRVALKLLHPNWLGNDREVRRFLQEGKVTFTLLESRHIPRVYDFGEGDDGLLFIAFEFIDGEELSTLIEREAPMKPVRVGQLLLQALYGLMIAHDFGIFHRDIKPSNILISDHDGPEWLNLLDFGVAKVHNAAITETDLTISGSTVGTVRYLPPEALFGQTYGADSDLYSLGLVAYEMLTGEHAIRGTSTGEIIANQISAEPIELSLDGTPVDDLRIVVNRMLHKDRQTRYNSAFEAFKELQLFTRPVPENG